MLAVEHPSVITLGKNADPAHITVPRSILAGKSIEVVATDRGGEVTMHMPGQQVIYPILPISRIGLSVREYVAILENVVIALLGAYGIESHVNPKYPGVWIGNEKICAIGVRIKNRVSMHGLALNVNNRLDLFDVIVPCGITDGGVTSMQKVLGRSINMSTLRMQFSGQFSEHLRCEIDVGKSKSTENLVPTDYHRIVRE